MCASFYFQYYVGLDYVCREAAQRRGGSQRGGRNTEEAMIRRRGGDQPSRYFVRRGGSQRGTMVETEVLVVRSKRVIHFDLSPSQKFYLVACLDIF